MHLRKASRRARACPPLALLAAALLFAPGSTRAQEAAGTGIIEGTVVVLDEGKAKRDRSNVVVSVEVPGHSVPKGRATIRQRDRTFIPDLTVVTKNSVVSFPNDDKIFHNVFSLSRAARFDLGLYKSGTSKAVKLRREGVVNVYCNIHPEMVSQIKVVDTPFYDVAGRDGRFRIEDVPAGTHSIEGWLPYGSGYEGKVVVKAGEVTRLRITVKAGRRPKRHRRKDGTSYGRYR